MSTPRSVAGRTLATPRSWYKDLCRVTAAVTAAGRWWSWQLCRRSRAGQRACGCSDRRDGQFVFARKFGDDCSVPLQHAACLRIVLARPPPSGELFKTACPVTQLFFGGAPPAWRRRRCRYRRVSPRQADAAGPPSQHARAISPIGTASVRRRPGVAAAPASRAVPTRSAVISVHGRRRGVRLRACLAACG
jgi:hypothetical protein